MPHRIAIRDWILLFFSGAILSYTLWPPGEPIRVVVHQDMDGTSRQYTLDAHSPDVAIIQERIKRWDNTTTPIPLVVARWRHELADFYCQNLAGIGSTSTISTGPSSTSPSSTGTGSTGTGDEPTVTQVSFDSSGGNHRQTDAHYWLTVREKTDDWIKQTEALIAARKEQRGQVPFRISEVRDGPVGAVGLMSSLLIGVMLATGFSLWAKVDPPIHLCFSDETATRRTLAVSSQEHASAILVEVPFSWIRVHQPLRVKVRRFAASLVVACAGILQIAICWAG